jgi:hypothetical protein
VRDGAGALLALWNDVAPEVEPAYNEWHAREHVPERLTVPGFCWGRRYGHPSPPAMPRYLTLYGLRDAGVLDSEPYHRLLREPTPASAAMRPALRHVSRWVCEISDTGGTATEQIAVWTSLPDAASAREALAATRASGVVAGHVLARRRIDADPLPWLAARQDHAIEGDWLLWVALAGGASEAALPAAAVVYRALPVGA